MKISYFSELPEHICVQIYQCIFKNVLDELCMVYDEYRYLVDIRYSPPHVSFIEDVSNLQCVKHDFYKMMKYCKYGYLSNSISYKNDIQYYMRNFTNTVISCNSQNPNQTPGFVIRALFAPKYNTSPIVDKLITNIYDEPNKEFI